MKLDLASDDGLWSTPLLLVFTVVVKVSKKYMSSTIERCCTPVISGMKNPNRLVDFEETFHLQMKAKLNLHF